MRPHTALSAPTPEAPLAPAGAPKPTTGPQGAEAGPFPTTPNPIPTTPEGPLPMPPVTPAPRDIVAWLTHLLALRDRGGAIDDAIALLALAQRNGVGLDELVELLRSAKGGER